MLYRGEDMVWRQTTSAPESGRGERLYYTVEATLSLLPLHLEKVVRSEFSLANNPKLEDIQPGALADALQFLRRADVAGMFQEFVS